MNALTTATISADGYTAEIALRGGQLLSLTSQGENLVVPAPRAAEGYPGAVLAPWPNRIVDATYTHDDVEYRLPVNEDATGAALHGLLTDVELRVQHQLEGEVHLVGELEPSEGYPFRLDVVVVYRVSVHLGLSCSLMVRYAPDGEPDRTGAPFGAGFHPYLTAADAPLTECRLRLPAIKVAKTKVGGKVIGRSPVSGDLDFTAGPLLAGRKVDHAYTELPEDGWTAELLHGPSGLLVRMIADTPWAQVYTGERINRAGVAVEPMTCPPNAFNSGENLIHLAPGEAGPGPWHRVGYSIEALRL